MAAAADSHEEGTEHAWEDSDTEEEAQRRPGGFAWLAVKAGATQIRVGDAYQAALPECSPAPAGPASHKRPPLPSDAPPTPPAKRALGDPPANSPDAGPHTAAAATL